MGSIYAHFVIFESLTEGTKRSYDALFVHLLCLFVNITSFVVFITDFLYIHKIYYYILLYHTSTCNF